MKLEYEIVRIIAALPQTAGSQVPRHLRRIDCTTEEAKYDPKDGPS